MMSPQEITMDQASPPSLQQTPSPPTEQQSLLLALDSVLVPLAQLCVAKGIPVPALEERVRQAFVEAARATCEGANPQRLNSRISTLTGLTRREVTRIQSNAEPARPANRSAVSELFTHWLALPAYQDQQGPKPLPRIGPAPSFDSLAQSVTRDVHPRSLLEALCRLGLAEHDVETDVVRLLMDAFVPRNQWAQMVSYLGDNVGDHLRAAVANVLGQGNEHFEQALFADELSPQSLREARQLISKQWRRLMTDMAPRLEALMKADALAGRPQDQSLRVGLYSWTQVMDNATENHTPGGMT
jgi:hypothetical protein